jgi:hypothetical protein
VELAEAISSILIIVSWIVAAGLIVFLGLIGRFCEIRFRQKSGYQLLLIPLVLFTVAAVWDALLANEYTGHPLLDFVGTPGPDLLFMIGGVFLIALGYRLYRIMMGGRQ